MVLLRVCFKTIKVAKGGYRRGRQRRGKKSFLFISGGKAAIVFQFEEQLFHQMTFFVCMPVSFSGMLGNDTAGENHNSASFLQPAYKLIAVIAFVCQYEFAVQIKGFQQIGFRWRAKSAADSRAHPVPHGLLWSSLLCSVRFPRDTPLFSPAGVLVDLDRGAVQHQGCFIHQLLPDQGCEDIFPHSAFCPCSKPAVHALPWPKPLRKIPPWYSGIQPIQNCAEQFSITSSGPPSLRLLFWRKQILDPIPLFFADFMSFHVLYFIISALYTQSLSFKTDYSAQRSISKEKVLVADHEGLDDALHPLVAQLQ